MFSRLILALTTMLAIGIVCGGFGEASETGLPRASYAVVGGETSVPYGWVDFCGRRPAVCTLGKLQPVDIRLTRDTWAALQRINAAVNESIQPITNVDHWGTMLDHWDYPVDGKGDCKIYALFKRKLLIEQGFPRQALLMTIVHESNGEGHAILTVKTDRGDFVLDNLSEDIRPWDATDYQFVKRQAQDDPNVWLDLGGNSAGRRRAVTQATN